MIAPHFRAKISNGPNEKFSAGRQRQSNYSLNYSAYMFRVCRRFAGAISTHG